MNEYNFADVSTKLISDLPNNEAEATYIMSDETTVPQMGIGWLVVVSSQEANAIYPLQEGTNLVGRALGCQVQLVDKSVSRQHIKIQGQVSPQKSYQFIATDLNSANGLIINNRRISSKVLEDEDYLQVGRFELVFKQLLLKNKPR